jgi:hypothetical protein
MEREESEMTVTGAKIERDAYYDTNGLCQTLGLRYGSIERARREKTLRFTKRGGRTLFRGNWIEDWLAGAEQAAPAGSVGA